MTDTPKKKTTLTLNKKPDVSKTSEGGQVRQSFSHGRSKTVAVEVKKKRSPLRNSRSTGDRGQNASETTAKYSKGELDTRMKALKDAMEAERVKAEQDALRAAEEQRAAQEAEKVRAETNIEDTESASSNETAPSASPAQKTASAEAHSSPTKPVTASGTKTFVSAPAPKASAPSQETKFYGQGYDARPPRATQANGAPSRIMRDNGPRSETSRSKPALSQEPRIFKAHDYIKKPEDKKRTSGYVEESATQSKTHAPRKQHAPAPFEAPVESEDDARNMRKKTVKPESKKSAPPATPRSKGAGQAAPRKLTGSVLTRVLNDDEETRTRSVASYRRAKQKQRMSHSQEESAKIVREVIITDTISVSELANRMAERGAEVVKALMKLGMMVTINQVIDADTAEVVCSEFGHTPKRVSDSDIEIGLGDTQDKDEDLLSRAPVVTVMGHVDHGKTSLLDALRSTDVVGGEAGGITQHIGAYQVTLPSAKKITFIDTPGHAAFTEMRARGANLTDIVILVVAADDGIMPQTIEAINHATAAGVPIVVAINKIDKPDVDPTRVRSELLQHGVILEDFGGDVLAVEVSAKKRMNLDKLEEAVLLQAEVLDLKANPNRAAEGVVVESRIDRGRGNVATVLVQKGTLKVGDIFVAGKEWGRVRALNDSHAVKILEATPSVPVEILGFNGLPAAGDELFVVDSESRAREIAEYRLHKEKEAKAAQISKANIDRMMNRPVSGELKELALVVKTDVQGSLEAITTSLMKLSTDEVAVKVLHGAVGGINESDVTLARASGGLIIGFNVRANPQARDLARRDGLDIRYYSIIYDVLDDVKAMLGGLLSPTLKENFLGYVDIRQVFNITKVGKIAGSYVTEGMIKRGAKVRLLRNDVVIHEGSIKTLRRNKDEVAEVKSGFECGIAFENYDDLKQGDVIECFEIEQIARSL